MSPNSQSKVSGDHLYGTTTNCIPNQQTHLAFYILAYTLHSPSTPIIIITICQTVAASGLHPSHTSRPSPPSVFQKKSQTVVDIKSVVNMCKTNRFDKIMKKVGGSSIVRIQNMCMKCVMWYGGILFPCSLCLVQSMCASKTFSRLKILSPCRLVD